MNDKLFISLETTLNGHKEETCINANHILWFAKFCQRIYTQKIN